MLGLNWIGYNGLIGVILASDSVLLAYQVDTEKQQF